jgi:hypothetical protein
VGLAGLRSFGALWAAKKPFCASIRLKTCHWTRLLMEPTFDRLNRMLLIASGLQIILGQKEWARFVKTPFCVWSQAREW